MKLYQQWEELASEERSQEGYNEFWENYFLKEKDVYKIILGEKENVISGKVSDLSKKYGMDSVTFSGFLDGINTSLEQEVNLENLEEDTEIKLNIDFEKLYFNMQDAKADWLYGLPEWEDILTEERRKELTKEYRQSKIVRVEKIGRNDPCSCGSGKKYKKCCGK